VDGCRDSVILASLTGRYAPRSPPCASKNLKARTLQSNSACGNSGLRACTVTAVLLHRSYAVALIGMMDRGGYMNWIEVQPGSAWFFDLHRSLGLFVGVLRERGGRYGSAKSCIPHLPAISTRQSL